MIPTLIPTRFEGLAYGRHARNVWRFIDSATGHAIGAIYRTRAELLADAERFHAERFR